MKIKLLFTFSLLFFNIINSIASDPLPLHQVAEKCGTKAHIEYLKSLNPSLEEQMIQGENLLQLALANHPETSLINTIYTIPVVVHVVYFTSGQNISDAQVQSQIDVLNEDYGRRNSDKGNTPAVFGTIASPTNFQFCLAKHDMNNNPTNGIERRQTTVQTFDLNDDVKFFSRGGLDAWDVNTYLNIWVCDLGGFILGYSEPPATIHTNTFGSVIHYTAFGRTGVVTTPYHLGRTCTHELGHCLNLKHTFGDDAHCGPPGDNVFDTPDQDEASFGCFSFPHTDQCSPSFPGIMFMNYMDYSDDDCANMFTHYQAVRMNTAINIFYPSLMNSAGCLPDAIETVSDFQFSLYPNPSMGILNLDMFTTKNIGSKVNVRVTNVLGEVVHESVIQNPNGFIHQLDLQELSGGVYYVSLFNEKYKRTEKVTLIR
jgi:hypothetical protein